MNIVVETSVNQPISRIWKAWTTPSEIVCWNAANDDWHTPNAEIDLRKGGMFRYRMEAKDGSMGFDYCGSFDEIIPNQRIVSTLDDGRSVSVEFAETTGGILVRESFETESSHDAELQRMGWQAILNNFKRYIESNGDSHS